MFYLPSEQGQGMLEYALILVLVAIVVVVAVLFTGQAINNLFQEVADTIDANME